MIQLAGVCLDTDVCVDFLRQGRGLERLRLAQAPLAAAWISAVTLVELRYGVSRSPQPEREEERMAKLLAAVTVRDFDARAAHVAALVRVRLDAQGRRIGMTDSLIGGHALAEGAVLMTRNVREFSRIEGLAIAEV